MIDRFLAISPGRFLLAVLLLVCASYSNTLYSPLVLDDMHSFVEEPRIYQDDFSVQSLTELADTRFGKARFVPLLSFSLNHYFSRGKIVHYHLTNIAIHLLAVVALFFFLKALLRTETGKKSILLLNPEHYVLFVCGLWALNPVQTNAVTYIVQRMTALAALFYLAALAFYLYGRLAKGPMRRLLFFGGCGLASALAFLSKENSYTLPVAILLVEGMFVSPHLPRRLLGSIRWYHWLVAVVGLGLLLPFVVHTWQIHTADYSIRYFTLEERLLTQLRVVVFYLSLLVLPLPQRLNLDHDFVLSTAWLAPPTTILSGMLLAGLFVAGIMARRRVPLFSFGVFWFFLNLLIESTVIPLELIFEHRLYLPSIGFFMGVVAVIDFGVARSRPRRPAEARKIVLLVMIILITVSSVLTTIRNEDWRDSLTIYEDCYLKSPEKSRAVSNYGMVLAGAGRRTEALALLERALDMGRRHNEEYITTANNILNIHKSQGEYEEAVKAGERYFANMTYDLNFAGFDKFTRNWGYAYFKTGRYEDALNTYTTGLRFSINPQPLLLATNRLFVAANETEEGRKELGLTGEPVDVPLKMARLSLLLRLYDQADKYLQTARELQPEHPLLQQLQGELEEQLEKNRLARQQFQISNDQAYRDNGWFRFYITLARFVMSHYPPLMGRPLYWLLDQARGSAPDSPFVAVYLARWEMHNGRQEEAVQRLERALRSQPDNVMLLGALGPDYLGLGRTGQAVEIFTRILELFPGHPQWAQLEKIVADWEALQGKAIPDPTSS
ncbi:MAG: tetratricopeptide repeat protein [Desulfobacterales bacterium]|nr:tetratricopeptide repeat protein [Desulfobacterales bacterium]